MSATPSRALGVRVRTFRSVRVDLSIVFVCGHVYVAVVAWGGLGF